MVRLPNGVQFPAIGFGTWQLADGPEAEKAVIDAVAAGYRLFDTAVVYRNEASVGRALRICGVDRSELFVTTKVWNDCRGYDTTLRAFDASRFQHQAGGKPQADTRHMADGICHLLAGHNHGRG